MQHVTAFADDEQAGFVEGGGQVLRRRATVARIFGARVGVDVQRVERPAQLRKVRPHGHVEKVVPIARPCWHARQLRHVLLVATNAPDRVTVFGDEARQARRARVGGARHQLRQLVVALGRRPVREQLERREPARVQIAIRPPAQPIQHERHAGHRDPATRS